MSVESISTLTSYVGEYASVFASTPVENRSFLSGLTEKFRGSEITGFGRVREVISLADTPANQGRFRVVISMEETMPFPVKIDDSSMIPHSFSESKPVVIYLELTNVKSPTKVNALLGKDVNFRGKLEEISSEAILLRQKPESVPDNEADLTANPSDSESNTGSKTDTVPAGYGIGYMVIIGILFSVIVLILYLISSAVDDFFGLFEMLL